MSQANQIVKEVCKAPMGVFNHTCSMHLHVSVDEQSMKFESKSRIVASRSTS